MDVFEIILFTLLCNILFRRLQSAGKDLSVSIHTLPSNFLFIGWEFSLEKLCHDSLGEALLLNFKLL